MALDIYQTSSSTFVRLLISTLYTASPDLCLWRPHPKPMLHGQTLTLPPADFIPLWASGGGNWLRIQENNLHSSCRRSSPSLSQRRREELGKLQMTMDKGKNQLIIGLLANNAVSSSKIGTDWSLCIGTHLDMSGIRIAMGLCTQHLQRSRFFLQRCVFSHGFFIVCYSSFIIGWQGSQKAHWRKGVTFFTFSPLLHFLSPWLLNTPATRTHGYTRFTIMTHSTLIFDSFTSLSMTPLLLLDLTHAFMTQHQPVDIDHVQ